MTQQALIFIEREERCRFVDIFVESSSHALFVIVGTLVQLAAALITNTFLNRRIKDHMISGSARFANATSRKTRQQFVTVHLQVDDMIQFST
ncbi:hypothetical protein D1872_302240 [compost metagenome]